MQTSRTRLVATAVTTLTLVVAATSAVAAHPDEQDDPFGFGGERLRQFEQRLGRFGDMRMQVRGLLGGAFDSLVRTETTYQAEDGFVTRRVDSGTLASASEAGLEYTLATGEVASVSTDEDTQIVTFSEETVDVGRGFSRERLVPEAIDVGDITAGSEIVVWALSQDDGTFLAERVVVRPALDEVEDAAATEADDQAATEDAAATEAEDEAATEAAAATEAEAETSPAPADA